MESVLFAIIVVLMAVIFLLLFKYRRLSEKMKKYVQLEAGEKVLNHGIEEEIKKLKEEIETVKESIEEREEVWKRIKKLFRRI